ncbi:alkaline phosphatase family protein [Sporomusa sphaeroides]|jgi:2,3-bisphosphoglycerate-independent phosphoglycerate mutase|uniref:alkaline phosphatase family protein n=1 Tax=Sporomusa sphaeroides TaxID=47679 RepID=UPI00202E056D|nr:alkaline phosphatase family protein [Sporomusa sphaeroides]MCM0758100.1 alkaline phosphatase family protein [Sporomusa sphaeroides DSM 2875]HML31731.1 alkaline phosphatase family protein [Sporomusa sphaeroides]
MRVLFIFIDGIGLGRHDPVINPLVRFGLPSIASGFGGALTEELGAVLVSDCAMVPIDTTLGVEGLPQSATGQAAILTGLNTAKIMGRHIQAFPGPELSKIITDNNFMKELVEDGLTATSANLYLPDYFELVARRKRRHSAITLAALSTGMSLRSLPEIDRGQAVYQDITNEMLGSFGVDIPPVTPRQAARNLIAISQSNAFTIFEYFQTDRAGHKQDWHYAQRILQILDEFIGAVRELLPADTLLLITSDHGNFEDMGVKTHTVNKVPFIAIGAGAQKMAEGINNLSDIAPAILAVLRKDDLRD